MGTTNTIILPRVATLRKVKTITIATDRTTKVVAPMQATKATRNTRE